MLFPYIWALSIGCGGGGGGGGYACQYGFWAFFPTLPIGVRACQDGLGHFFPTDVDGSASGFIFSELNVYVYKWSI